MSEFKVKDTNELYGGELLKLQHESKITKTPMDVNIFLPSIYKTCKDKLPVIMFLSGLTCTPQNPSEKSFIQYFAEIYGIAIIFPDTSPRGAGIEGEDKDWDFGLSAGFYVDSIKEPWNKNYLMYSYILNELLPLINKEFPKIDSINNISITGHSMGGYGSLMFYLRNPNRFKSCSAFAPICNPSIVPWGEKCFGNYLGNENKNEWLNYDPCNLIKNYPGNGKIKINEKILIHVGDKDVFEVRDHQLKYNNLIEASKGTKLDGKIDLQIVKNYDHSYYFVSSFIKQHVEFHLQYLKDSETK